MSDFNEILKELRKVTDDFTDTNGVIDVPDKKSQIISDKILSSRYKTINKPLDYRREDDREYKIIYDNDVVEEKLKKKKKSNNGELTYMPNAGGGIDAFNSAMGSGECCAMGEDLDTASSKTNRVSYEEVRKLTPELDWEELNTSKSSNNNNKINEAGYSGYSMSNNAIDAYDSGEKPKSQWTKSEIKNALKEYDLKCDLDLLMKLSLVDLRDLVLTRTSWHHTSSYYNKTDFYSIDDHKVENITNDRINEILEHRKPISKTEVDNSKKKALVKYSTWEGSRNHPKKVDHEEECEIDNTWAYTSDGKKSLKGKYISYKLID